MYWFNSVAKAEKIAMLQPYDKVWIRKDLFVTSVLVDFMKTEKVTVSFLSFASYIAWLGGCGGSAGKSENCFNLLNNIWIQY